MYYMGAHWCHLTNTTELSMCSGNTTIFRNNCDQLILLLLGCVEALARCSLLLQMDKSGLSICHDRELHKTGQANRDAFCEVDSGGSKEPRIRRGPGTPANEQLSGGKAAAHCKV